MTPEQRGQHRRLEREGGATNPLHLHGRHALLREQREAPSGPWLSRREVLARHRWNFPRL
jgi:hypothetical protein